MEEGGAQLRIVKSVEDKWGDERKLGRVLVREVCGERVGVVLVGCEDVKGFINEFSDVRL